MHLAALDSRQAIVAIPTRGVRDPVYGCDRAPAGTCITSQNWVLTSCTSGTMVSSLSEKAARRRDIWRRGSIRQADGQSPWRGSRL